MDVEYYDKSALLDRLTGGIRSSERSVVFLVGSAVTAPEKLGAAGVLGVESIVNLIRDQFKEPDQEKSFDNATMPAINKYQAAFSFLIGRRGQEGANEIIKRAVWNARKNTLSDGSGAFYLPSKSTTDDACRILDSDLEGWALPAAASSLGQLISSYPKHFGSALLTTNFDPLLEVAIRISGGQCFRTTLHRDGNLSQTEGAGCHVIHLHGYWHGADTLHTPRQLNQPRPRLKASLTTLIKSKMLVVMGYGGWDDAFTSALMELVIDDTAHPEIIWTFRSKDPKHQELIDKLAPALDRARLNMYAGIDCHSFIPELLTRWKQIEIPPTLVKPTPQSKKIRPYINAPLTLPEGAQEDVIPEGDEADRPPLVEICVGRQAESTLLLESTQRICVVAGFGGQGKSTLVAQYFSQTRKENSFDYSIWRDCKEESERFENQLISVIERLSNKAVTANELSHQHIDALTDLLVKFAQQKRILFVFDNMDHYVDLEANTLSGNAETFLKSFLNKQSNCKVVLTCRPLVKYPEYDVLTIKLDGLKVEDAIELFAKRGAQVESSEIAEAHDLTKGHAFWLDLIAAQIARHGSNLKLRDILDQIGQGSGEIPTLTLKSIWATLNEKQRTVLRAMAETVKSETDSQIASYLQGRMNFQQVMRALRSLRSLNLIVVKPRAGSVDVLELHPLVREFIRRTFPKQERLTFINAIISVYQHYMGIHKSEVKERATMPVLQHWAENAELCVMAGKLQDAFDCLHEVSNEFESSGRPGEFARVAELLLSQMNWKKYDTYAHFDDVIRAHIRILTNLGREAESRRRLDDYAGTARRRDARFVSYCDMECYAHWVGGDYAKAIEWGERGKKLKDKAGADIRYDTEHHLALARRDSGIVDPALEYFLHGEMLETIIDPDEFDEERGGPFYGNIGRCLHLMGQIDPALICYRKSAITLESSGNEHVENQGFIRKWIGELLIVRGEFCAAKTFLYAARGKWESVSPRRVPQVESVLKRIDSQTINCPPLVGSNIERYCLAWIYGRESDFAPI